MAECKFHAQPRALSMNSDIASTRSICKVWCVFYFLNFFPSFGAWPMEGIRNVGRRDGRVRLAHAIDLRFILGRPLPDGTPHDDWLERSWSRVSQALSPQALPDFNVEQL